MKLIAVTDDRHSVHELASTILQVKDTVDYIHIREKSKTSSQIIELLNLLLRHNVQKEQLVINDRLDIALLMSIANIHLPSHSLPVRQVKQMFPHLTVGRSIHTFKEAQQAKKDGADYVLYGHCYETKSKNGKTPNDIHTIQQIKSKLSIPVIAIGGITPDRVSQLQHLQTDGIAIMSGIFSAVNPAASAQQYLMKCKEVENENEL